MPGTAGFSVAACVLAPDLIETVLSLTWAEAGRQ
jgi:hypothetical protein